MNVFNFGGKKEDPAKQAAAAAAASAATPSAPPAAADANVQPSTSGMVAKKQPSKKDNENGEEEEEGEEEEGEYEDEEEDDDDEVTANLTNQQVKGIKALVSDGRQKLNSKATPGQKLPPVVAAPPSSKAPSDGHVMGLKELLRADREDAQKRKSTDASSHQPQVEKCLTKRLKNIKNYNKIIFKEWKWKWITASWA